MRCDVNVSVRPVGREAFGTKVEVKNMNSFSGMQKAIDYEIQRQVEAAESVCCRSTCSHFRIWTPHMIRTSCITGCAAARHAATRRLWHVLITSRSWTYSGTTCSRLSAQNLFLMAACCSSAAFAEGLCRLLAGGPHRGRHRRGAGDARLGRGRPGNALDAH